MLLIQFIKSRFSLILIVMLALGMVSRTSGQGPTPDPLSGAVARSEAVFSGRFKYKLVAGFDEAESPVAVELLFSGSSWRRREVQDASGVPVMATKSALEAGFDIKAQPALKGQLEEVLLSHKGRIVKYHATPQPDGKVRSTSHIARGEQSPDRQFPPFPRLLGSFWFASTTEFIAKNRKAAVHIRAGKDNDGIDVYEWTVSEAEADQAFHGVTATTKGGGVLRIHVAPKFGYAVTRIEQLGSQGLATLIEAGDFIEVNGVFMPRLCKMQYFTPKGAGFFAKYTFSEVTDINAAIKDSDFEIELPVGTIVADARKGKGSKSFEVTGPESIPPDLSDVYIPTRVGGWFNGWREAVILGIGIGVVSAIAVRVIRRRAVRN
jgi:hypothetical protein